MLDKRVFITRQIPSAGIELLSNHLENVFVNKDERILTREELTAEVRKCDAVLPMVNDTMDEEIIKSGERLKIIANYGVGHNNVALEAATKRGIMVTNTPGVLTDATSDLAWALLFSTARMIPQSDQFTREGKFHGWQPMMFLGADITGKTLGILGAGRIGTSFALKSAGFSMRVLYCDHERSELLEQKVGAKKVDLETLLKESDFLSIHVFLAPENIHLIGSGELGMMKKSAILINTSRGPVIDEKALVKALRDEVIAGAGLDVFEDEPELAPGLSGLENVVLAPHIGSATIGARTKMSLMAAENIVAAFKGEIPPNLVNKELV